MQRLFVTLPHLLRRFVRDGEAVAAVEFALILPLLLTLYFGTVEAATLYTADRKVATVASTMADLVSREKDKISKANTLNKYFVAARTIMHPYPTTNLTQVVSLLHVDKDTGAAKVVWSEPFNGGTARVPDQLFPPDPSNAKILSLAKTTGEGYVIVSEIKYPYRPVVGLVFSNTVTLSHTDYFLPRYQAEIELQP